MVHPVQSVIESLYAAGRCPRIHVNATHAEVVCPASIREQWKERLIIDLDASYPLDLKFDEAGISADLSFGGMVTRCEFPWEAIYIVADRSTGRGIVLDRNMPESVKAMFAKARGEAPRKEQAEPARQEQAEPARKTRERKGRERKEPALAAVASDPPDDAAAPADEATAEPVAPAEAAPAEVAPEEAAPAPSPVVEEQAKKRRAAFRVIDGGG